MQGGTKDELERWLRPACEGFVCRLWRHRFYSRGSRMPSKVSEQGQLGVQIRRKRNLGHTDEHREKKRAGALKKARMGE